MLALMELLQLSDNTLVTGSFTMKLSRSFVPVCLTSLLCACADGSPGAQVKFFAVGDLPGGIVQSEVRDTTRVGTVLYAVGGSSAVGAGQ